MTTRTPYCPVHCAHPRTSGLWPLCALCSLELAARWTVLHWTFIIHLLKETRRHSYSNAGNWFLHLGGVPALQGHFSLRIFLVLVLRGLEENMRTLRITIKGELIQKEALLGTARILSKVLEHG